jgi:hypothetical protein
MAWTGWRTLCTREYSPMIAIRSQALASIPRLSDCFQQQSLPCLAMGCLGRYGIPYRELGVLRMRIVLKPIRALVRTHSRCCIDRE